MAGAGSSVSAMVGVGGAMNLDTMRYAVFVTLPFQGNVQFDRHQTEWGLGFRR